VLLGHTGSADFAAWNSDGTVIATTGWDATARLWDAASGVELAVIGGYFDTVRHAAWSPEGTRLVVTSWGGPARVFQVPVVNMLEAACSHAVRNLSPGEWEQFLGQRPYQETCPGLPVPGRDDAIATDAS
jgi:WD40 repeat protein